MRTARLRVTISTLALCALTSTPRAGDAKAPAAPDPAIARQLSETYSFDPRALSKAQLDQKSAVLDALWKKAAKAPNGFVPTLRAELELPGRRPFFYFDGGKLLLELSKDPSDRARALRALDRVDVRDVVPLDYVTTVHAFAREGLDTSAAAFRIFAEPSFNPYVAAHDLELHQGYSLLFMLLPSAHAAITPSVMARYPKETDESAKKALLTVAYHLAPEGDELLRRVAADPKESAAARDYARQLVATTKQIAATDLSKVPKLKHAPRSVAEGLAARRKAAGRISDEALSDIETQTLYLRTMLTHGGRLTPGR